MVKTPSKSSLARQPVPYASYSKVVDSDIRIGILMDKNETGTISTSQTNAIVFCDDRDVIHIEPQSTYPTRYRWVSGISKPGHFLMDSFPACNRYLMQILTASTLAFLVVLTGSCGKPSVGDTSNGPTGVTSTSSSDCSVDVRSGPTPEGFDVDLGGDAFWVEADRFIAVLFFSDDGESTLGLDGQMSDGRNTKILWILESSASNGRLEISVLGAKAETVSVLELEGDRQFPSVVSVPAPGCWTFELRTGGNLLGSLSFNAERGA